MIETSLGAQYLKAALSDWRKANPWANHIAWEQIPPRYRDEIEQAARRTITKISAVSPSEDVVGEDDRSDLVA
jgi:hypothetical protein